MSPYNIYTRSQTMQPISTPVTKLNIERDCQRATRQTVCEQTPFSHIAQYNPRMESYKVKMLKWIHSTTMQFSILITNETRNGDKVKAFYVCVCFFLAWVRKKIEKNAAHLLLIFSFFSSSVFFIVSAVALCDVVHFICLWSTEVIQVKISLRDTYRLWNCVRMAMKWTHFI